MNSKFWNSKFRPILGAALLLLVPMSALAQGTLTPPPAAAPTEAAKEVTAPGNADGERPMAACRSDVDTLCPGAQKGDRRKCLRENSGKLSPACQSALSEMAAKTKAMREACAADIQSHCAGIDPAGGKLVQCLRTNVAKLAPACGTAFQTRHPKG